MENRVLGLIPLVEREDDRCRCSRAERARSLFEKLLPRRDPATPGDKTSRTTWDADARRSRPVSPANEETPTATPWMAKITNALNRDFLWLLLASYAAAALWPRAGLWIRSVSLGGIAFFGNRIELTLPLVLLALLLANAGLAVRTKLLARMGRAPWLLAAGLCANLLLPLALLCALTKILRGCTDAAELQELLIGLTLVVAMPVAGSSAAWSQNGGGDVSLSLGLVLGSTLLSPFATPLILRAASQMTSGECSTLLLELAGGTNIFLLVAVVVPSALGLLGHRLLGEERLHPWRPHLGAFNALILLTLCYANAAVSLPHAVAYPDWRYLTWVMLMVVALCALMFAAGWGLSRLMKAGDAQTRALMYGLGMNNNGTGLVLAATVMASHSKVLLPLILYNLVQHLVAGCVKSLARTASPSNRDTA